MISTCGQRQTKQDIRRNTEKEDIQNKVRRKQQQQKLLMDKRVGQLPEQKAPWKGQQVTGAEERNIGKIAGKGKVKTMDENGNEKGQIYTVWKKAEDRTKDSPQRLKGESRMRLKTELRR